MDKDKLKLFATEEDVVNYAKVNGFGSKGTAVLVSQWHEVKTEKKKKKIKKGSKKFGIFGDEDIEIKED